MHISQLFGQGRTVFSCEVFPPKATSPVDTIYRTLDGLKDIRPDFISVTFGAGGSKVNQTTREIAGHLNISANTAKRHISEAMKKLKVKNRKDLKQYMLR